MSLDRESPKHGRTQSEGDAESSLVSDAAARPDQRHLAVRGAPRREGRELDRSALEALKLFVILVGLTTAMALLARWLV